MRSKRGDTTGHRDSGAVAVETAFVSMLLITILFGIVETSFLFKDYLAVSAAARAGARMGASQPRVPGFDQSAADQVSNALSSLTPANIEQVWVYRTDSTGVRPATCTTRCVPFTWSGTQLTTASSANWLYTSQNACAGDSAHDSLGVYLQYRHTSPLGFFFNGLVLSESTVMSLEPITDPDTVCS